VHALLRNVNFPHVQKGRRDRTGSTCSFRALRILPVSIEGFKETRGIAPPAACPTGGGLRRFFSRQSAGKAHYPGLSRLKSAARLRNMQS